MPLYEFRCGRKACKYTEEVLMAMDVITSYKPNKCPKHGTPLERLYTTPHLANMSGGTSTTEKGLLAKKQEQRKMRSRAHFKNEVLGMVKDPQAKRHFAKKFKKTKKMDHTKM